MADGAHVGIEIAFVLEDGTMCKVKSQAEDVTWVDFAGTLEELFDKVYDKAMAVHRLS